MTSRSPVPAAVDADLARGVDAALRVAAETAGMRRAVVTALDRELARMGLVAQADPRVEKAMAAELGRIADGIAIPRLANPARTGTRTFAAAEALADATIALANASAAASAGWAEQLRERRTLQRRFRRIPELCGWIEASMHRLARVSRESTAGSVEKRLTFTPRVLGEIARGDRGMGVTAGALRDALGSLGEIQSALGFFTCRAVVVDATEGAERRADVRLRRDAAGTLRLCWSRYTVPRVDIYPTAGAIWRGVRDDWRSCFELPRDPDAGRRLRVLRPAIGMWAADGIVRIARAGALEWDAAPTASNGANALAKEASP